MEIFSLKLYIYILNITFRGVKKIKQKILQNVFLFKKNKNVLHIEQKNHRRLEVSFIET